MSAFLNAFVTEPLVTSLSFLAYFTVFLYHSSQKRAMEKSRVNFEARKNRSGAGQQRSKKPQLKKNRN